MVYLKENYKKILPYAGIFFVLFMGSGLVKIPVGSVWFYVIKFGIIAAVMGIGVSAWWKAKKDNLPPTTYLKLALFVPFTIDFHLHYAFIFLTIILFNKKLLLPWNSPLKPIYLLFIWGFISYVINQFIEFNPLSFPLFVVTFFLPFVYFTLFSIKLEDNDKNAVITFLFSIILVMSCIIIIQIFLMPDVHPDFWTGGTQNAHISASLITIAFIIATFSRINKFDQNLKWHHRIILMVTPILLFFMDAKVFNIFILLFIAVISYNYFLTKHILKAIVLVFIVGFTSYWFMFTDKPLPISTLTTDTKSYSIDDVLYNYGNKPKGKLISEYLMLPYTNPITFIIGSGPGTFISRAALIKYHIINQRPQISISGEREKIVITYNPIFEPVKTVIQTKYSEIFFSEKNAEGSLFDKKSSLFTLLFETGIIGFSMLMWFFISAIKSADNKLQIKPSKVLLSFLMLILMISFFSYWLEQFSFTAVLYGLMGIFTINKIS